MGGLVCGTAAIGGQQRPASPEKKKVLFFSKHLLLSHSLLIYYIHWLYIQRAIATFRENRTRSSGRRNQRAKTVRFSSRRKNRVYTPKKSGSLSRPIDFFFFLMIYLTFVRLAQIDEFFFFFYSSFGKHPRPEEVAESREIRPIELTLKPIECES